MPSSAGYFYLSAGVRVSVNWKPGATDNFVELVFKPACVLCGNLAGLDGILVRCGPSWVPTSAIRMSSGKNQRLDSLGQFEYLIYDTGDDRKPYTYHADALKIRDGRHLHWQWMAL